MSIESRSSLELLYNVSRELTAAIDLRAVLQRVLFLSVQNVSGERGSILVLDADGHPIDAALVYAGQVRPHPTAQMAETMEKGLAGWVVRNKHSVLIPNTTQDPRWVRRADDADSRTGGKSAICVPLLARDQLVGVLTIVHPVPNYFNMEHLELIQAIADQSGATILNARLYEESRRQANLMTALAENAVTMSALLKVEEVLQRILDQTARALQVEMVSLAMVDENRQELEYRAATGKEGSQLAGARVALGAGVAGKVAQDGKPQLVQDARQFEGEPVSIIIPGVKSIACAPVFAQDKIIGVLEAVNPLKGAFDADALTSLTIIGGMAGTAIHNAQLYERIQAAHRRYRDLFADSIDPIFITDLQGKILEANLQACRTTHADQAYLQQKTIDQVHAINLEKTGKTFEGITEETTCSYTSEMFVDNNQKIPVDVYARRLIIDEADCLQWILRDISERKALETLQDDLASMIYHDLRSPLSNVISSLEVMATLMPVDQDEALKTVVNVAMRSTERIQRLLSSLLDTRRLEAGQAITNPQNTAPEALAKDAVEVILPNAESRHLEVSIEAAPNLPMVWVDPGMIRRVLINLLENALKFTPANGKLTVGAGLVDQKVHMWVKDTGPGISKEDQQRIFDKFIHLQDGKNAPKGIGLGLAFCRLAVEAHGGTIWVESEPGHGSRFIFTLPISQNPQP